MELAVDNLGYNIWQIDEDFPSLTSPIFLLGKKYENVDEVREKISSILWMTYRKGFAPIGESGYQYTSDRGFGCMIRSAQMLLAEALKRIHLKNNWLWSRETSDETYLSILNRFEDSPEAVYSIQRMALAGLESGKKISDWFSPNEISQILKKLVPLDESFSNFTVHVALDSQFATDEVFDPKIHSAFKPSLIIIPLRLGLSEINPIYIESLKRCLELEASMGIIGGRPNQALYFFGYAGDEILYFDPHICQKSGCVGNKETLAEIEIDETYHKRSPGKMAFVHMDPSIAVSFFCQTQQSFEQLVTQLQNILRGEKNPIFEVIQSRSLPWTASTSSSMNCKDLEDDLDIICDDHNSDLEVLGNEDGSGGSDFEIIV